jgi:beta-lactamase family protein
VLKALAPGLRPTWSDLATLMITVSDNVATNLIIDWLGMDAIQAWIDKAGLADTRLERRMMHRAAMTAGRGNWTSAADMETLLSAMGAGTCVSREASGAMRRALEAQQIQDRLPRRLGEDVSVASKTGNFTDVDAIGEAAEILVEVCAGSRRACILSGTFRGATVPAICWAMDEPGGWRWPWRWWRRDGASRGRNTIGWPRSASCDPTTASS